MRIILYTGKGGVGKTSIAAATAVKLAKENNKVMIMSTDQAHSLSDALETQLSHELRHVAPNLDAIEVDAVRESEEAWGNMRGYLKDLLTSRSAHGIEADELLVFPGLEELFSLFKLLDIYQDQAYDVLIVDCAPTGETLNLLKFPEVFGHIIETIMPMKRKVIKTAGPLIEKVSGVPMPKDHVFEELEKLMARLECLQALMLDKETVSLRLVTTPEKVVIKETKRNYTWLQLFDYNVDAVIVNKVYPKAALEGYFNQWVQLQEEGLRSLQESFGHIPMFMLALQKHELKGLGLLKEAAGLYQEADPMAVLAKQKTFRLIEDGSSHRMEFYLPFAEKEDLDLGQSKDELQIAVKNEKRCFALPEVIVGKSIRSAKFEAGILVIDFE